MRLDEFRVYYPSLKQLTNLAYTDPRVEPEGKKIFSEKDGTFFDGESSHVGKYIVYKDSAMPGKYIGIFISDQLDEDDTEPSVHVIAIDGNKNHVNGRVDYRRKKCREISESFSTMKTGEYLEFSYGRWKNDPKPDLLVFYDDGSKYIEGINVNYLSYSYIKKLNDIIDRYPGIDGMQLYEIVLRTAYQAVQNGYRKYLRSHVNPI